MGIRVNNQKNKTTFYPNTRYLGLLSKLNKHMGFNSHSRTVDHILREFFDSKPELVAKLDKMNLEGEV